MAAEPSHPPNPQRHYETPEALANDRALSTSEKQTLLRQWQRDLEQLETATEENMPHLGRSTPGHHPEEGVTADLLQRVSNCLLLVESD